MCICGYRGNPRSPGYTSIDLIEPAICRMALVALTKISYVNSKKLNFSLAWCGWWWWWPYVVASANSMLYSIENPGFNPSLFHSVQHPGEFGIFRLNVFQYSTVKLHCASTMIDNNVR